MWGFLKKNKNNTPCNCFQEPTMVAMIQCNVYEEDLLGLTSNIADRLRILLYTCPQCGKRTYVASNNRYIINEVKYLLNQWLLEKITTKQLCEVIKTVD